MNIAGKGGMGAVYRLLLNDPVSCFKRADEIADTSPRDAEWLRARGNRLLLEGS